jgi:hypothetical protein
MNIQQWKDAYIEIAERLKTNITTLRWVDLWHNQIGLLSEEHPFPAPAIFVAFRTVNTGDLGLHVQDEEVQVDFYIFYETFADTFKGSYNQQSALAFLQLMSDVHSLFHGYSGDNFSEMRHTGFAPVDTGNAGNLYRKSFVCLMRNYNAHDEQEQECERCPSEFSSEFADEFGSSCESEFDDEFTDEFGSSWEGEFTDEFTSEFATITDCDMPLFTVIF